MVNVESRIKENYTSSIDEFFKEVGGERVFIDKVFEYRSRWNKLILKDSVVLSPDKLYSVVRELLSGSVYLWSKEQVESIFTSLQGRKINFPDSGKEIHFRGVRGPGGERYFGIYLENKRD